MSFNSDSGTALNFIKEIITAVQFFANARRANQFIRPRTISLLNKLPIGASINRADLVASLVERITAFSKVSPQSVYGNQPDISSIEELVRLSFT